MNVKLRIAHKGEKAPVPSLCAGCSAPIAHDATFCEICHAPIVRKYCARCSKLIPENSISCPYCGTSGKIKAKEKRFELSNVWIFLIGALILAYFLVGGFFQEKKTSPLAASRAPVTQPLSAPPSQNAAPPKSPTLPVSNPQPLTQSDEEGTRLNLEGYTLIQKGDYQNAEAVLRQAVVSFPKATTAVSYKFALYNLGHVLRRTGRPKEALTYLEKAAKLDPEWTKAQSELAVARQEAVNTKVL